MSVATSSQLPVAAWKDCTFFYDNNVIWSSLRLINMSSQRHDTMKTHEIVTCLHDSLEDESDGELLE